MVIALAGNKADLEDKRKVTAEVSSNFVFYYFYCLSILFSVGASFSCPLSPKSNFLFCWCSALHYLLPKGDFTCFSLFSTFF